MPADVTGDTTPFPGRARRLPGRVSCAPGWAVACSAAV